MLLLNNYSEGNNEPTLNSTTFMTALVTRHFADLDY